MKRCQPPSGGAGGAAWCQPLRLGWVALCFLAAAGSTTPARASDLVKQAEDRLKTAEARLEAAREQVATERQALAEELDAATGRKIEIQVQAEAAERALADARAQQRRGGETPEVREARMARWTQTLWTQTATGGAPASDIDRLEAAVMAGLGGRLTTLEAMAQVRREEATIMARSGEPATVPVLRLGGAMALAAGDNDDTTGFLLGDGLSGRPSNNGPGGSSGGDGSRLERVSGVKFPAEAAAQLRSAASGRGPGVVPVDVDGALARTDAPVARSFWDRIEAGGVFVVPIFLVGLLGLVLIGERILFFVRDRLPERTVRTALSRAAAGDLDEASRLVEADETTRGRVLRAGLRVWKQPQADRDAALEAALLAEEPKVQRSLNVIAACAAIAPLLGLLGTVTGMITTFDVITLHGTGNPKLLSGGISVALVTTQLGLVVAVPILLAHAVLSRVAQRLGGELEGIRAAVVERSPGPLDRPVSVDASGRSDGEAEEGRSGRRGANE